MRSSLSTAAVEPAAAIMNTGADLPLRRQDSNLDHRNQNPRCCRYTTADWASWSHACRGSGARTRTRGLPARG